MKYSLYLDIFPVHAFEFTEVARPHKNIPQTAVSMRSTLAHSSLELVLAVRGSYLTTKSNSKQTRQNELLLSLSLSCSLALSYGMYPHAAIAAIISLLVPFCGAERAVALSIRSTHSSQNRIENKGKNKYINQDWLKKYILISNICVSVSLCVRVYSF